MGSSGWGIRFGGAGGGALWRGAYARHRLDISVEDISFGVLSCGWQLRREKLEAEVMRRCALEEEGWFVSRCGVGGICGLVRRDYGLGMRFSSRPSRILT